MSLPTAHSYVIENLMENLFSIEKSFLKPNLLLNNLKETEKALNEVADVLSKNEIAEEIPNRVQSEWSSFKKEVIEEYERLEKSKTNTSKEKKSKQHLTKEDLIQTKIDNLRSKVININKQIEERN